MTERTRIKICGITRIPDAMEAVKAGADLVGLVFHPSSPRAVDATAGSRIAKAVRSAGSEVGIVAVVVDPKPGVLRDILAHVGPDLIQFHGDESPEYCRSFDHPFIKAHRLSSPAQASTIPNYRGPLSRGYLIDAFSKAAHGGTGTLLSEDLMRAGLSYGPGYLAGGLSPANVAELVSKFEPFGVDVSSSLEDRPGEKNHARIHAFVRAVRQRDT